MAKLQSCLAAVKLDKKVPNTSFNLSQTFAAWRWLQTQLYSSHTANTYRVVTAILRRGITRSARAIVVHFNNSNSRLLGRLYNTTQ